MFETPILFIIFNRPDTTQQVFDAIKKQKPKYLYVAADGPRPGNLNDVENCKAARDIIKVDWECDLKTLYRDENLGCGKGPAEAISWFFKIEEKGIIIEDDAIPSTDFFQYAEELLNKYNKDKDVYAIGSMHIDNKKYGDGSYYFSMMNRTLCAWATWRRAWLNYDYDMKNVTLKKLRTTMELYGMSGKEKLYWSEILQEIHKDRLKNSSWDLQFIISIWLNKGKGICPNVNLTTNIGFNNSGTHTKNPLNPASNLTTFPILPMSHPTDMKVFRQADLKFHKTYYQPFEYGIQGFVRIPYHINKKIKKLLGHNGPWIRR